MTDVGGSGEGCKRRGESEEKKMKDRHFKQAAVGVSEAYVSGARAASRRKSNHAAFELYVALLCCLTYDYMYLPFLSC